MEVKKQVPSITVNIRVPQPTFERLEALIFKNQLEGKNLSKNSVYVEALATYLDVLDELGDGPLGEGGLVCSICGKTHIEELTSVGAGLTDVNGKLLCSACLIEIIG